MAYQRQDQGVAREGTFLPPDRFAENGSLGESRAMILRLHFVDKGEYLDQRQVVSHSPRVGAVIRNGCTELTILPVGLKSGSWARRAAVAKTRQHSPLLDQLEALAVLVDRARNDDEPATSELARKNAEILSHARELASSIGDATIALADDGVDAIKREAANEVEAARSLIRRHPLRSVGIAAIASAIFTALYRGGRRRVSR